MSCIRREGGRACSRRWSPAICSRPDGTPPPSPRRSTSACPARRVRANARRARTWPRTRPRSSTRPTVGGCDRPATTPSGSFRSSPPRSLRSRVPSTASPACPGSVPWGSGWRASMGAGRFRRSRRRRSVAGGMTAPRRRQVSRSSPRWGPGQGRTPRWGPGRERQGRTAPARSSSSRIRGRTISRRGYSRPRSRSSSMRECGCTSSSRRCAVVCRSSRRAARCGEDAPSSDDRGSRCDRADADRRGRAVVSGHAQGRCAEAACRRCG